MSDETIVSDYLQTCFDRLRAEYADGAEDALGALSRLIAAKEQAEKERDSFRRTLDERWEADKKAFAAIMRAAGRTHGVPPNKEVVAYFVEQNDALTARLRSMCEAMEPFIRAFQCIVAEGENGCIAEEVSMVDPEILFLGEIWRARAELDAAKKEIGG